MLYLLGLAALFFTACRTREEAPPESPSLPLNLGETDSVPGVKPKLEEVHRRLREAGVSDEQMDRGTRGVLEETDLLLTTIDLYERDPKNEKLKRIIDGPFKEIAQLYYIKGLEDYINLGPCVNHSDFGKAMFYDPNHQKASYYYGYCGRDVDALRHALALDPKDTKAWEALSQALVEEGHFREAETAAVEWMQLDLMDGRAVKQLASIYMKEGEFSMATRAWEYATLLRPLDGESHLGLGFALFFQGESTRAEKEFWTASVLDVSINMSLITFFAEQHYLKAAKRHLRLLAHQVPLLQKDIAHTILEIEKTKDISIPKVGSPTKTTAGTPI